ncbi:MAG: ATP-binding protein [Bacteroidia bacterium]
MSALLWSVGGLLVGLGGLAWGIYQYYRRRALERELTHLLGTSEWRQAVSALLQRAQRKENENSASQVFLAEVSHELKTPLAILLGYLDTLEQGGWQDPEILLPFLRKALAQVHRMNALVQDILLLTQIESGNWLIQPEPVLLYPLVEDVWSKLEPLAQKKRLTLRLPSHEVRDLAVEADPLALQKIFKNLLENAIQYSPEGKTVTIGWEPLPQTHRVKVWIADEGIGIPAQHLPHIFKRFYRVDKSRSRQSGGTGLGLAIVQELIEAHGQTITVESQEGVGTRFTFYLPACA